MQGGRRFVVVLCSSQSLDIFMQQRQVMRSASRHLRPTGLLAGLGLCLALCASSSAAVSPPGIQGTVTNGLTHQGVKDILVVVYNPDGTVNNSVCTGAGGAYSLSVQPLGSGYRVGFESTHGFSKDCGGSTNYLPAFYANQKTLASATPVSVSSASLTTVNQALDPGGAITGTVTDATTKAVLSNIEVDAYDTGNGQIVSQTCTGSDGIYSLFALPTGSYKVAFKNNSTNCGAQSSYTGQYYRDASSLASAAAVPVTVTKTTGGIDAALQPANPRELVVNFSGAGKGTVSFTPTGASCSRSCARGYTSGAHVTIKAVAAKGSRFTGWSGPGCSGTKSCTLTMSANRAVTANFAKSSSSGGPGLTLPGPVGGASRARRCSLKVVSSKVLIKAPKKKSLKRRLDRVLLRYKCRQASRLTLTGFFRKTIARKHGRARHRTVRIRALHARAKRAKFGTFYVKVPKAVLKALRTRTKVSASFTLRVSGPHGKARITRRIKRLRTTR
jgi:hypothetical protein